MPHIMQLVNTLNSSHISAQVPKPTLKHVEFYESSHPYISTADERW